MNTRVTAHDVYGNEYSANLDDMTQTIRVYAVIIRDSKILLTKQWDGYSLPGGGVELAEHLEDALVRELKEETGLDVKAGKIFYNTDRLFQRNATSKPVQAIMFFYDVASVSGKISNQSITESEKTYTTGLAEWIDLDKLDSITFRHSVDLHEILNHHPALV
jgi:ADP-ribose pyrophosphatase YjhB (NUDIX family)